MKVKLIGMDNQTHSEGYLSEKIAVAAILKRNERYYKFDGVTDHTVYFKEVEQPYTVTEF